MSGAHYHAVAAADGERAIDLLAAHCPLSRLKIKDAMHKGAVWIKRRGQHRLRRATETLRRGERLDLYYDADILAQQPAAPTLVADERPYSIWYKPAGMLTQGTQYGDHCALLRLVERQLNRPVFLLHRLDREADGLVLIAHTQRAASALGKLWQQQDIRKRYRVCVRGIVDDGGEERRIANPIEGAPAETRYRVLEVDRMQETSLLDVLLITGRKHQIRRHFAELGHAVVGDYRYGTRLAGEALQLTAVELGFRCPLSGRNRVYRLPGD